MSKSPSRSPGHGDGSETHVTTQKPPVSSKSAPVIGKLRDELVHRECVYRALEAKVLIERGRQHYNRIRPRSALGYRPPAPKAIVRPTAAAADVALGDAAPSPPPEALPAGPGFSTVTGEHRHSELEPNRQTLDLVP